MMEDVILIGSRRKEKLGKTRKKFQLEKKEYDKPIHILLARFCLM